MRWATPLAFDPNAEVMWHFEPHVAEQILREMLRQAGVRTVFGERLQLNSGVKKDGKRIAVILMEPGTLVRARVFIDATYEGDVMARTGVAYHVGREANSIYNETMNGVQTLRVSYNGHNFFRPISPYRTPGDPTSGLLPGVQAEPPGEEGSGDCRV